MSWLKILMCVSRISVPQWLGAALLLVLLPTGLIAQSPGDDGVICDTLILANGRPQAIHLDSITSTTVHYRKCPDLTGRPKTLPLSYVREVRTQFQAVADPMQVRRDSLQMATSLSWSLHDRNTDKTHRLRYGNRLKVAYRKGGRPYVHTGTLINITDSLVILDRGKDGQLGIEKSAVRWLSVRKQVSTGARILTMIGSSFLIVIGLGFLLMILVVGVLVWALGGGSSGAKAAEKESGASSLVWVLLVLAGGIALFAALSPRTIRDPFSDRYHLKAEHFVTPQQNIAPKPAEPDQHRP